jgi:hypothetical protein
MCSILNPIKNEEGNWKIVEERKDLADAVAVTPVPEKNLLLTLQLSAPPLQVHLLQIHHSDTFGSD